MKLPRDRTAPVRISLGYQAPGPGKGSISSISVELSRRFSIELDGLPDNARVGHGTLIALERDATGALFVGEPLPLSLFKGRYRGMPAILAHGSVEGPEPREFTVPITIGRSGHGSFPTVLSARLPAAAHPGSAIVTGFDLELGRRYRADGKRLGFPEASCPLPAGISIGEMRFARMSIGFEDGTEDSSVLERSCIARG